jgi:hypothetical protein
VIGDGRSPAGPDGTPRHQLGLSNCWTRPSTAAANIRTAAISMFLVLLWAPVGRDVNHGIEMLQGRAGLLAVL